MAMPKPIPVLIVSSRCLQRGEDAVAIVGFDLARVQRADPSARRWPTSVRWPSSPGMICSADNRLASDMRCVSRVRERKLTVSPPDDKRDLGRARRQKSAVRKDAKLVSAGSAEFFRKSISATAAKAAGADDVPPQVAARTASIVPIPVLPGEGCLPNPYPHHVHQTLWALSCLAAILVLSAGSLHAQIYAEIGDAGQTLATAQTTGVTSGQMLISITGTISGVNDADMFIFTLTSPMTFSASTVNGSDPRGYSAFPF